MNRSFVLLVLIGCGVPQSNRGTSGGNGAQAPKETPPKPTPTPAKVCDPFEPRIPEPELIIGPAGIEAKLVALIDSAQTSLDVLIYELATPPILTALIDAHERGVVVRMVIDRNHNNSAKNKLTEAGIDWVPSPEAFSYAHAKTLLIDGLTSVIMSANMNDYSMNSERNYGFVSHDVGDAEDLGAIFAADYAGTPDIVTLPCTRLVVSPINARTRLVQLIASAANSLDLAIMYLSDEDIFAAVLKRQQEGVTVRVLLADPQWMKDNTDTAKTLVAAGASAKFMTEWELHAKLIIADDRAFVGSENMSWTSLNKNREVGAFLTNSELVRAIREQFDQDWAASQDLK